MIDTFLNVISPPGTLFYRKGRITRWWNIYNEFRLDKNCIGEGPFRSPKCIDFLANPYLSMFMERYQVTLCNFSFKKYLMKYYSQTISSYISVMCLIVEISLIGCRLSGSLASISFGYLNRSERKVNIWIWGFWILFCM